MEKDILEMRALSKRLIRYSFPLVSPQDEEIISCLKQREISIDGYELIIYLNRCKYNNFELETLQIYGKYFSFLPFSIVCKVAYRFLGNKELSFVEVMHYRQQGIIDEKSRKIYVFTVNYNEQGEPIPNPLAKDVCYYDGLVYNKIDPKQITFF